MLLPLKPPSTAIPARHSIRSIDSGLGEDPNQSDRETASEVREREREGGRERERQGGREGERGRERRRRRERRVKRERYCICSLPYTCASFYFIPYYHAQHTHTHREPPLPSVSPQVSILLAYVSHRL